MTFLLCFLAIGLLLQLAERLWPIRAFADRKQLGIDVVSLLVAVVLQVLLVRIVTPFILRLPAVVGAHWLVELHDYVSSRSALAVGLSFFLGADFLGYWSHRLIHTRWLWATHAFHHSARNIYWLSGLRGSPLHVLLAFLPGIITQWLVSPSGIVSVVVIAYACFHNSMIHSNLRIPSRALNWLFVTGRYHFVHHARDPRISNNNFGFTLTIWDRLFGTHIDPDTLPEGYPIGLDYEVGTLRLFVGIAPPARAASRVARSLPSLPIAPLSPVSLSPYQRRLFLFLSVATFFEGFDLYALAQLLPNIRRDLGLLPGQGGLLVSVIGIGAVLACLLVRQADIWGRRRVLSITIVGYTVFSLLTGLMSSAVGFAICQLAARIFLYSEYAVAAIYVAEEYPAHQRGSFIGMLQVCNVLGGVFSAAIIPLLLRTGPGWRGVFFIGAIPLALLALARRQLRETTRFTQRLQEGVPKASLFRIFRSSYRGRMLLLGLIWALTLFCTSNAVLFWKEFALAERGLTDADVGFCVSIAALTGIPVVYVVGRLLDRLGRRGSAGLVYAAVIVGVLGAFAATPKVFLVLSLVLLMGVGGAIQPLLSAWNAELFPTELRGDAYAWSSNVLGRMAMVVSPFLIGSCAAHWGWATTLRATVLGPLLGLLLIWTYIPETSRRELEATSQLPWHGLRR